MPASPRRPFTLAQPDGTSTPTLYAFGDEEFHYYADSEGYTVHRETGDGGGSENEGRWWVYAESTPPPPLEDDDDYASDDDAGDDRTRRRRTLRGALSPGRPGGRRRSLRLGTANPRKLGLPRRLLINPDGVRRTDHEPNHWDGIHTRRLEETDDWNEFEGRGRRLDFADALAGEAEWGEEEGAADWDAAGEWDDSGEWEEADDDPSHVVELEEEDPMEDEAGDYVLDAAATFEYEYEDRETEGRELGNPPQGPRDRHWRRRRRRTRDPGRDSSSKRQQRRKQQEEGERHSKRERRQEEEQSRKKRDLRAVEEKEEGLFVPHHNPDRDADSEEEEEDSEDSEDQDADHQGRYYGGERMGLREKAALERARTKAEAEAEAKAEAQSQPSGTVVDAQQQQQQSLAVAQQQMPRRPMPMEDDEDEEDDEDDDGGRRYRPAGAGTASTGTQQQQQQQQGMRQSTQPADPEERLGLREQAKLDAQKYAGMSSDDIARAKANLPPRRGTLRNLVIPLVFSDHLSGQKYSRALPNLVNLHALFNHDGPHPEVCPAGSIRSLYREYSRDRLTVESTVVNAWIRVSAPESGPRSSPAGAFSEALHTVDGYPGFDLENYHSVTFVHSSYPAEYGGVDCYGRSSAERVWAHAGSVQLRERSIRYASGSGYWGNCGNEGARPGMLVHEVGHILGLRDMYDRSPFKDGSGLGVFDYMAYAWGPDNEQFSPAHPSAYSKLQLGWIRPRVISRSGTYSLVASSVSAEALLINAGYSDPSREYILVENRQPLGADSKLGPGGLAIYHIDESAPGQTQPGYPGQGDGTSFDWDKRFPRNGMHYAVALCQADRLFDLELGRNVGNSADLWPGTSVQSRQFGPGNPGNVFQRASHPNSDGYAGGEVVRTGLRIRDMSDSATTMTFKVEGDYLEPERDGGGADVIGAGDQRTGGNRNGKDPPDKVGDNNNNSGGNTGGAPSTCKDDSAFRMRVSGGRIVNGCDFARSRQAACKRKIKDSRGTPVWRRCPLTCRSYFWEKRGRKRRFDTCAVVGTGRRRRLGRTYGGARG